MGRCRFVQPDTVRLHLSDSDWVEVKKQLTVGEERAAFQHIVGEVYPDGRRRPNVEMMGIAEMMAYIVDWSFRDGQDKPVQVSVAAIQSMDSESFKELESAVEAHVKAMEAEREAIKNVRATVGKIESVRTLPSVAS